MERQSEAVSRKSTRNPHSVQAQIVTFARNQTAIREWFLPIVFNAISATQPRTLFAVDIRGN